ncbi:hypothetical protein RND81_06G242100 [Saponaria officinalis]|uniref:Glycosyltransferase n=1 Tax=Saponaria officinalis TaxID=3572 RepID=A0AAW1KEK2_SAPOF
MKETLHIAMYPWLAMGHLTSFLHLANKLAERGHQISFFIPTRTRPKLASHNRHPSLITFIPIVVPHVDGLPVGAETTNDVPASEGPKIMDAMDLTQDTIGSHLSQLKPDYIFFDFTQWLPKLARKHGVKSLYYATTYMISLAYFSNQARGIPEPEFHIVTEADLLVAPPGFPCPGIRLRRYEARTLVYVFNMNFGGGMTLSERHNICFKECDVVAIKTCREMEGGYCEFVKKHMNQKSILLVGPVVPETPMSRLDDRFDGWLNGFSHGSVVFCALGSECVLDNDQFQELLHGLELTGSPFLAALRPPKGSETIESALPEGYLERTKGRGIIHGGWVQQQLILHHPSVGCFITHCGAGSLSEAMLSECQLVLFPQSVDQFLNARLMSTDLRVGVEVNKDEDDGSFTKEAICEAVQTAMDIENKVGNEVRDNHTKWRNTLLKPGLEDSYINEFVKSLQGMLG